MILVLGGTQEAHKLAVALQILGKDFIVSMAGVTDNAPERSYKTRRGGFGGVDGLIKYLGKTEINAVVDATHPFAVNISRAVQDAANNSGVPVVRFTRDQWKAPKGADWRRVSSLQGAASTLPEGARVFLSVGANSLEPFIGCKDIWFLYRVIKSPLHHPAGLELIQRPPFFVNDEVSLMQRHGITHLVTKNSGGNATYAKIDAAVQLGLPIIIIDRPDCPVLDRVGSVQEAIEWLDSVKQKGE